MERRTLHPPDHVGPLLSERLREQRPALEHSIRSCVRGAVSDPLATSDPEYIAGMGPAISQVLDGGLAAIERGGVGAAQVPPAMIAQARRAVRVGVSLDTILRRYAAGHELFDEYVLQEASDISSRALRSTVIVLRSWMDLLMASIASEYTKEVDRANGLGVCRLSDHVRQLLDGSRADIGDFAYGIDGWHIGLVARGGGAAAVMRRLAALLGRDLLEVSVANATAWAWLGGQRRLDFAEIERSVSTSALEGLSIAVGEPGMGLPGWRTTHDQARAALALALHRPGTLTRYADDPLLASALRDVTVRVSLRQIFVEPLSHERDGGTVSRSTLRAYLAAGRNASTAAHVLGVNRHTVERRLRRIEERLGRPIQSCAPELELALRLEALPNEAVPQS